MLDYNETMKEVASLLNTILKEELSKPYPYAPGFNNSSPFRVRGAGQKKASGAFIEQSEVIWNEEAGQIEMLLPNYWQYIDEGRRPGQMVTKTRERNGTVYNVIAPDKLPPLDALKRWASLKGLSLTEGQFFGMQYNIGKYGIAATNFYDTTIMRLEELLDNQLADRLAVDIEEVLDKLFETSFEVEAK